MIPPWRLCSVMEAEAGLYQHDIVATRKTRTTKTTAANTAAMLLLINVDNNSNSPLTSIGRT